MFTTLAERARVPVVAHLDHGEDIATCRQAIACGFTSVMFDGSALPLEENIAQTAAITRMAHELGVSVEAELGLVGYPGGAPSRLTDPAEVAAFRAATGVDALAVSVGTTHLMTAPGAEPDHDRLQSIARAAPGLPLVLHGGSGLSAAARARVVRDSAVCKVNIGTELRQCFGRALRDTLAADPALFDRNAILSGVIAPMVQAARAAIGSLAP
jgi:fructose-bisphosphate aldolase class II